MRALARLSALGRLGILLLGAAVASTAGADGVRIKDLGKLQGWRENALVGYGIVTGLAGTGDSPSSRATRQALSNALAQLDLVVPPDQVQSRNVAVVMVAATLSPFAREGDTLDVTVTSAGDARSLLGGSLLLTPLKGPDGKVHALAQGPLSVGGYRYAANGNLVQKNHPTTGSIPGGATVELGVSGEVLKDGQLLTFVLTDPDFTTASNLAAAINDTLGQQVAEARDANAVDILVPEGQRRRAVTFVAQLEAISVQADRRAKVVVNERTGTVVAGGDVTLSPVSISHGDIKISVATYNEASQPNFTYRSGPGVRTTIVSNTTVEVDDRAGPVFVAPGTSTVSDLVQTLVRLQTSTRDIISILQAIKAAGALHAELVIQ
jgi:flagellar P-ring protein precursor FlgI